MFNQTNMISDLYAISVATESSLEILKLVENEERIAKKE